MKYGKSSVKRKTASQTKSRAQRIEQLKQIYRRGMDIDSPCSVREDVAKERRGEGEELDDVDQLLQWTENLDEQVLNTTPNSLQ